MWVIVGLGNPGAEYAHTRHNVGFMVVEALARRWRIALRDVDDALRVGSGRFADQPVMLAEPQAFMNNSGAAIARLQLGADDALIAVYDDLDLPAGQLRVRPSGGSAGHRGVASLSEHFGAAFARVRVGIGRPPEGGDAAAYVLESLSASELIAMRSHAERAGDAVECIVTDGTDTAMTRFNTRVTTATVDSTRDDSAKEN